jgi:hypothetical protein
VTLVADSQGYFLVEPIVNGVRLRMLVDTGASLVAISREDARRIGSNPVSADFRATVSTANRDVFPLQIVSFRGGRRTACSETVKGAGFRSFHAALGLSMPRGHSNPVSALDCTKFQQDCHDTRIW